MPKHEGLDHSLGAKSIEITKEVGLPTEVRVCGVKFILPDYKGVELHRDQAIMFKVPAAYAGRILDSAAIHHKKAEKHTGSIDENGWDNEGAYTRVLVFDTGIREWVQLGDDKFAEPRAGDFETENIHDCISLGHLSPSHVAVIGVGKGANGVVTFRGLELDFFPEDMRAKQETILTPGTTFVDLQRGIKRPRYGGGERPNMGVYRGSVPLNSPNLRRIKFPITTSSEDFYLEEDMTGNGTGRMHIPIKGPINLERLEIAAGDTEDYGDEVYKVRVNGPENFRRGWARVSAFVRRANGEVIPLMDNVNVPPRGVLKGSPTEVKKLDVGDEIIVQSNRDTTYVMGYRIQ